MGSYRISESVKKQILDHIKNEGISVKQAVEEHGVSDKTIYKWLGSKTEGPSYAEVAKLRRENKALKEIIGEMTVKLSESQKKN